MSLYVIPVGVERITKLYHAAREMTPELRIERGVRFGELEHMYRHVHSATYWRGVERLKGLVALWNPDAPDPEIPTTLAGVKADLRRLVDLDPYNRRVLRHQERLWATYAKLEAAKRLRT
jgi:hypothetical protein